MSGYVPHDPLIIAVVVGWLAAVLFVGLLLTRLRSLVFARAAAWLLAVGAVVGVERLTAAEPAGVRMLAIIAALLGTMKALVSVEDRAAGGPRLALQQYFMFATGWPGMRPAAFANVPGPPRHGWAEFVGRGLRHVSAGALVVALAWLTGSFPSAGAESPMRLLLVTILLLPGLSLLLHFGVFDVLAGFWRLVGADCHALFRAPLKSTSLSEFWGRRWNLAFSHMAAVTVFRPLKGVVGRQAAMMAAFLFSGGLHELAISVPVRAGYGLPMLYFVLHAVALQMESALSRRGRPIDSVRWAGRLWTLAWLLLPLPLLFHRPFLRGCVWPLIGLVCGR
jgi:alginate O-acetyltransferase complex protein AlgI